MMLITPATMAPFIRFFRVIAADAHRAPPRTTLITTVVVTVAYWLCGIPVVSHWDRKSVAEGRSADLGGRRIIKKKGCLAPSSTIACFPVSELWVMVSA